MTYTIERRVLTEQATAVVQATLTTDEVGGWLPGAFRDVIDHLKGHGVVPEGPPFARYAFDDDRVRVEAGFPVPAPVPAAGPVTPSRLPAGPAAVTIHYGPYERLAVAYDAVSGWLKEHGYTPDGPHWEVYHTDPRAEPDPARWRTDVVIPYLPA